MLSDKHVDISKTANYIEMNKKSFFRFFCLLMSSCTPFILSSQNPTYSLDLRNDVQVLNNVYEFDIYLLRTGTIQFEYASGQYGILINPLIKNGGTLTASIVAGSTDPVLDAKNQDPNSVDFYDAFNVIRVSAGSIVGAGNGALISNVSPGTKICRIRLTNSNNFDQYRPDLTWTTTVYYPTQIYAYVGGTNTKVTTPSNHTTSNLFNPIFSVTTSIDDYLFDDFRLQVYPNPFKDKLFIDYNLLNKSKVTLSVFDTNGKLVDELVNEVQQSGKYTKTWDSVSRHEGVYILKLQVDNDQKILRIVLSH